MSGDFYIDNNSFMHRLDARTKMALAFLTVVAILMFEHPVWLIPITCLSLLQLYIAGAFRNLRRIRFILIMMSLSSMILWNFFSSGVTPLWWKFEVESFLFAVNRTLLIVLVISSGMVLISTTRNEELVLGLIKIGLPYRVGFALSTALRLLPTIGSSIITISQAQRSRGLDLHVKNPLERLRRFLPLLVPVFISTIRNTNTFAMALESKGFGARDKRSYYLQMQFKRADYLVLGFALVFVAGSIVLRLQGIGQIPGLTRF
jgi:energy-coupling factor transport system permease protein